MCRYDTVRGLQFHPLSSASTTNHPHHQALNTASDIFLLSTTPKASVLNTASDIFLHFHHPQKSRFQTQSQIRFYEYISTIPQCLKTQPQIYFYITTTRNASVLNTASDTFLYCHLFSYTIGWIYFLKLNGVCTYNLAFFNTYWCD